MLLIGPLETNFIEILIEIRTFSLKKIRLKMLSVNFVHFVSASMCYDMLSLVLVHCGNYPCNQQSSQCMSKLCSWQVEITYLFQTSFQSRLISYSLYGYLEPRMTCSKMINLICQYRGPSCLQMVGSEPVTRQRRQVTGRIGVWQGCLLSPQRLTSLLVPNSVLDLHGGQWEDKLTVESHYDRVISRA